MNRTTAFSLLLALTLLAPAARADDPEAEALFQKAKVAFEKNDVAQAEKCAREACETAATRPTQMSCLLLLGRVHQVKTGDLAKARWCFKKVIELGIGLKKEQYRERLLKAQAMLALGNLNYARDASKKRNVMAAVGQFQAGHKTYPTPDTADVVAQLMYRLALANDRTPGARKKQLNTSLKLCDEVFARLKREPRSDLRAKAQLQRVLTLRALGQDIEAELAWRKVDKRHLATNSLYQQALLLAVKGKPAAEVAKKVREFMEKTRPTVRARNEFRNFVRTEPDFQRFRKKKSWRFIEKDEPPPLQEEEYELPKLKTPKKVGVMEPIAKKTEAPAKQPVAAKTTAETPKKPGPAPTTAQAPAKAPPPPPKHEASDESLKFVVFILAALLLAAMAFLRLNKA